MKFVVVAALLVPCLTLADTPSTRKADGFEELPAFNVWARPLAGSAEMRTRVELADEPWPFRSPTGLSDRTANFYLGANQARSFNDTLALRGIANTPLFGGRAVGFYVDDLPLAGSGFTLPAELIGLMSAEVHRGPTQNTVFGRTGAAGVVRFLTPGSAAHRTGEVRAGFGDYDARAASGWTQFAANGRFDTYLGAAFAARDGYLTNTQLGRDVDHQESLSGLARVRFRPVARIELTLLAIAQRARDGAQPLVPLGGPLFTVNRSGDGELNLDAANLAFTAAYAAPGVGSLRATTSYSDWDLSPYFSVLAFGPFELGNRVAQRQRDWNQEVKFVSADDGVETGATATSVRWQAGLFTSSGETSGAFARTFGPMLFEQSSFTIDARELAAFGEMTFTFAPATTLTVGARIETTKKTMRRQEVVPAPQTFELTHRSSALLPKIALHHPLSEATAVFAALGAGYKPGGFSAFTGERALAAFGPERSKALEAGITQSLHDKSLSATLRFFHYDITGYQIERSFATGAAADDYLVVNAPRARSLGSEVELAWRPSAHLTLAVDVGVTDVKLREFRDPFTGERHDGNRAPYVPRFDASLRGEYQHATGWFAAAEVNVTGTTYYTESADAEFRQETYTLLRARFGYATARYRAMVFAENLRDEGYYRSISPGTFHGTPGAPRLYGAAAALKW